MERFKAAAIRYKNKDGLISERHGKRHHEIIRAIHNDGEIEYYKQWHEDGFIFGESLTARFINREEATKIARDMKIPMIGCVLTSEDLW